MAAAFNPVDPAAYAAGCPANYSLVRAAPPCERDFGQMRALGFDVVKLKTVVYLTPATAGEVRVPGRAVLDGLEAAPGGGRLAYVAQTGTGGYEISAGAVADAASPSGSPRPLTVSDPTARARPRRPLPPGP